MGTCNITEMCPLRARIKNGLPIGSDPVRGLILNCPGPRANRCEEINTMATTGFDQARRVLARRYLRIAA